MSAERTAAVEATPMLDLCADAHVHTGFSAGRDSVGVVVMAADRAGLTSLTFADQAGPDSTWLPAYGDSVRRAQQRTDIRLSAAAEIEIIRADGWLAWPPDLGGLDAISVSLSRLPLAAGPATPQQVRGLLAAGSVRRADVIERAVEATVRGVERAARYAPARLSRPLSLLNQIGISEDEIDAYLLTHLVEGCRVTHATVEVSEAWRTPSAALVRRLLDAGVTVAAASDARYAAQVGRWQYVATL
ncbi:hydrolase [Catenuloplanes atrovinosus]|uniref:Hydrolase n=1 Tax=Catenuloplanes atrovinosus TaxID=137266 RepID=A0AAE3YVL4_9ACTN|nr:hydrolase [Catenuloplanes atrovinosus]MDR7280505.1 putative hydrolase [Catenuloplanes atrovinosus]